MFPNALKEETEVFENFVTSPSLLYFYTLIPTCPFILAKQHVNPSTGFSIAFSRVHTFQEGLISPSDKDGPDLHGIGVGIGPCHCFLECSVILQGRKRKE
jgi:hypothetical protein